MFLLVIILVYNGNKHEKKEKSEELLDIRFVFHPFSSKRFQFGKSSSTQHFMNECYNFFLIQKFWRFRIGKRQRDREREREKES